MNSTPGVVIVCPDWRHDGPWGTWTGLQHLRMQIGLPLPLGRMGKILSKLGACPCGKALAILFYDPADPREEPVEVSDG